MCVKIVTECKEYVFLETVAIQDTQNRVFLFIRYLHPDKTRLSVNRKSRTPRLLELISGRKMDISFKITVK